MREWSTLRFCSMRATSARALPRRTERRSLKAIRCSFRRSSSSCCRAAGEAASRRAESTSRQATLFAGGAQALVERAGSLHVQSARV
jgi:hypothetical protein